MGVLHTYASGKTVVRPSSSHTKLSDGRVALRGTVDAAVDMFGSELVAEVLEFQQGRAN